MSQVHQDSEKPKVRGIPIDLVEIDAVEANLGGYERAELIPDNSGLLIRSLDTVLAKLWKAGLKPPYIQLAEYPFDRFIPVPIKIRGNIHVVTNQKTKPVGLMGWVRYKRKIHVGSYGKRSTKILLPK